MEFQGAKIDLFFLFWVTSVIRPLSFLNIKVETQSFFIVLWGICRGNFVAVGILHMQMYMALGPLE